jgi:alkanesulfonate monooxygenase
MGMRSFIFSGYPHLEECDYVGKLVLPHMRTCSLPHEYGRVPDEIPATPLGNGPRV